VISLGSRLTLEPGLTEVQLRKAVINLEKEEFFKQTRLDQLRPGVSMEFSATGRYDEILRHINGHKYYLNLSQSEEISFEEAMLSWYDNVYEPIVRLIESEEFIRYFRGRTASDLYVWIVRRWDDLKKKYGQGFPLEKAAQDFTDRYGKPDNRPLPRVFRLVKRLVAGRNKKR